MTVSEEQEPSSEPAWVHIKDGSDRDWRSISMYELEKLEHAINEVCVGKNDGCPAGHLKEMHDSGNEVIDKVRSRIHLPLQDTTDCPHHCSVFRNGFDNNAPMEHHCDFLNNTCEVEEEKIRQDERTKVLDGVISIINKNCFEMDKNRLKISILLLCQDINSLRTKPEAKHE